MPYLTLLWGGWSTFVPLLEGRLHPPWCAAWHPHVGINDVASTQQFCVDAMSWALCDRSLVHELSILIYIYFIIQITVYSDVHSVSKVLHNALTYGPSSGHDHRCHEI